MQRNLKIGIHPINANFLSTPAPIKQVARHAEDLGFAAAITARIRLAKKVASLDVLSNGRVMFGFGVGYLEAEFKASGVPMDHRGTRADEYLKALRALWEMETPEFQGQYVQISGVDAYPRPLQNPLPVIVSTDSDIGDRRAVRFAHGAFVLAYDLDEARDHAARLTHAEGAHERMPGLGALERTISIPTILLNLKQIEELGAMGYDRVCPGMFPCSSIDEVLRYLETVRPELLGN